MNDRPLHADIKLRCLNLLHEHNGDRQGRKVYIPRKYTQQFLAEAGKYWYNGDETFCGFPIVWDTDDETINII